MNTTFPNCIIGTTTCANDVTDYVISATELSFGGVPGDELDGKGVEYFVRYPDNTTVGFESGYGIYTHSTRTVTRAKIYESSSTGSANNDKVNWGSSAVKHIALVVSGHTLGNMARVITSLNPWEDVLVGCTGQSNPRGELARYTGSPPADTRRVKDWSRIAANTGSPAWRYVVKSDQYTYSTNAHVGVSRSVLDSNGWEPTGSICHAFATQLAAFFGRVVRTIQVTRGATAFADPTYGWLYNTSASSSVAKIFKDEVDAAITALHLEDPRQTTVTKLHFYLIAQGETDAVAGEAGAPFYSSSSNRFGYLLAEHLRALEDTARWNITDHNTVYLLFDIPEKIRGLRNYQDAGVNEFDGHAQAAFLFGDRALVVPTSNLGMLPDYIHYTGEGADELGTHAANLILSNTVVHGNTGGAFRLTKVNKYPDPTYTFSTDGAGTPASSYLLFNVGRTELKIHYNSATADVASLGLGLFQVGDVLRIEKQSNSAIYRDFTITALAVDNTTYFSYTGTTVSVGTLVNLDTVYIKPQNTAFHDGENYTASTVHNLQGQRQNLANKDTTYTGGTALTVLTPDLYINHHLLMANEQGIQYRTSKQAPRVGDIRTDDAVATTLLRSWHYEDGRVEYVRATVCYKVPANNNVGVFIVEGVVRRTGSGATATFIDWSTVTQIVDEEGLATNPTLTASTFLGAIEGWVITVTGKTATNIDWICELETIEIPNQVTST